MPGLERVPTGSGEPQATAAACVSTRGHVGRRVSGERTKGRPHGRMTMVTANPQRACSSRLRWEPLGRFLGGPGAAMRRGYPTVVHRAVGPPAPAWTEGAMARMEHNLAALGEDSFERHGDYESLWRAGAAITPVIFLLPPPELRYVLEHSGARAIITAPELLGGVLAATEGLQTLQWVISTGAGEAGNGKVIPLDSLEDAEPSEIVPRDDHDLAALLYTGGTTGRAKGVMLSHENLWRCGKSSQESSRVPGIRRHVVPLPLSHAFGLIVTIVGLHAVEPHSSVLQRWFDPAAFLELVQEHRVQSGAVVPSMLQMLLAQPLEDYDLSSLAYLVCGAAPLPKEAALEIERRVPGLEVREGYGCTESGAVISSTPAGRRKLGSVGLPLPSD